MSTKDHGPDADALARGHETRDANPAAIAKGITIIFVIFLFLAFMLKYLYDYQAIHRAGQLKFLKNSPFELEPTATDKPLLQVNEPEDLARLRAVEDERLSSYGWVDEARRVVHIPIERAMELTLERGLLKSRPSSPGKGEE